MTTNEENLKLVNYYIRCAVSTEEARKKMNDEEKRDLSIVSGYIRQTTNKLDIQFVDPLINVIWKFYHYTPINMVTMMNDTHIGGLISQFM